ncbi:hypothetical protein GCM10022295_90240 [Streptomyces osmaniensis]|uniref:Transposase IS110-like N-terminal domain-containing protein n=1 Tax=Streptomyces osmaniensis TaxID=593134 RepID=A0ABP6Z402_9ACTN
MTTLGMPAALPAIHDAEPCMVVLGVDTHKDVHVAAVLDHLGRLRSSGEFPATAAGYRHLLDWAPRCGTVLRAGVECTGSYGAGLARYLATQQVSVVEVNQPDRSTRRRRGKTDAVDAVRKDVELVDVPLRMALWRRGHEGNPVPRGQLIHHGDAGRNIRACGSPSTCTSRASDPRSGASGTHMTTR